MEPRCVYMNITCALGGGTLQWLRRERTLPSWSGNEAMVQVLLHHHQGSWSMEFIVATNTMSVGEVEVMCS